jgi:chromosome segregation ATPase
MRQQQAMSAANLRGETGISGQQQQHQLRGQLQDEKQSYERLRTQTLLLTNELQERDDEIATLKKREQVYEQTLKAKEKMYDQDVHVRMQLGKRLESVLLDKEELSETIESLTEQLRQQAQQLLQLQAAASIPPPPPSSSSSTDTSTTPNKTN